MSSSNHPERSEAPNSSGAVPRYVAGSRRGRLLARFADGASVEVESGRVRAYPGLRASAPCMQPFYAAFAGWIGKEGRVLDAGSGAGAGARQLTARGLHVVAVDSDPAAVAFARSHAPHAEHVQCELSEFRCTELLQGAILADVLGHTADPDAVLLSVRKALVPGAALLVAEPAAHVSQRLSAPQRRAFSVARLRALLVRTGFQVEAVLCERLPFVALLAKATDSVGMGAFVSAYDLAAAGQTEAASQALASARGSGSAELEAELLLAQSELFLAQGAGDAAAQSCFRASELVASDARPFVGLGRIALASGDASEALQLALEALRRDPTEAVGYALAGLAANALGHPDALTAFRAAANLAPDDADLACELARLASSRGDHALGLLVLERWERYGATPSAAHHVTRAWILLASQRRDEAVVEARIAGARGADLAQLEELRRALLVAQ